MTEGWIKLHRKFLQWEWYTDINTKVLFIHLLLKANYDNTRFRGNLIERGYLEVNLPQLSIETNLSKQNIRTALSKLEKTGEIIKKSAHNKTLIKIVNYNIYQDKFTYDKHSSNIQSTNNQHITNSKISPKHKMFYNIKENKKVKIKKINNDLKHACDIENTKDKIQKENFAEFVTMSKEEYNKLFYELGESGVKWCINKLNVYKGSKGINYKSDYMAIKNWVIKCYNNENQDKLSNPFFTHMLKTNKDTNEKKEKSDMEVFDIW